MPSKHPLKQHRQWWKYYLLAGGVILLCVLFLPKPITGQNGTQLSKDGTTVYYSNIDNVYDTSEILKMIDQGAMLGEKNTDAAILYFNKTLQYAKQVNYPYGISMIAIHLAKLYSNKGMFQPGMNTLAEAIPYATRSPKTWKVLPRLYGTIAIIYHIQGNFSRAVDYYHRAIAISEKIPAATGTEYIYSNLAGIFDEIGERSQALNYLDKAERIALRKKDYQLLESIYLNRGIIYKNQKDFAKGIAHFKAGLSIVGKYHFTPEFKYLALSNLGYLYLSQEKPQLALSCLLQAQNIKVNNVNSGLRNEALYYTGMAYYMLHDYARAKEVLEEAYTNATEQHLRSHLMQANKTLSEVYLATNEYDKAFTHQQEYMSLKDSVEKIEIANNLNQYEVKARLAEKDKELYQKKLLIAEQEHRLERKNIWLISIIGTVLVLATFIFGRYKNYQHKQEIGQLKAMIAGEEKERNRIGQELHDGIGGMLAAINMNLGTVQKKHQDIAQMKDLDEISNMLQDMATEVRKTAHNLMPDILLRHGFTEAVRLYCEQVSSGDVLQVESQFYGNLDALDKPIAFSLFRILQELIQNVIKHSYATYAAVQIRLFGDQLALSVEDNGVGFDDAELTEKGVGLQNLRSRVQALQGHTFIESAKGKGTTAYIELDLQKLKPNAVTV